MAVKEIKREWSGKENAKTHSQNLAMKEHGRQNVNLKRNSCKEYVCVGASFPYSQ